MFTPPEISRVRAFSAHGYCWIRIAGRIRNLKGVAPDIEVELEPKAWRLGHDRQLAVEVALAELKNNPLPKPKKPAYPNYHLHK